MQNKEPMLLDSNVLSLAKPTTGTTTKSTTTSTATSAYTETTTKSTTKDTTTSTWTSISSGKPEKLGKSAV